MAIDAIATQDLSSFNLDLIGFDVTAITVNGADATFSRDGQELTITPAERFPNGGGIHGRSPLQRRAAGDHLGRHPRADGLGTLRGAGCPCSFVISEPDGAANFYPVNDHPLDKATYTLRVTVPKPYEVAAERRGGRRDRQRRHDHDHQRDQRADGELSDDDQHRRSSIS